MVYVGWQVRGMGARERGREGARERISRTFDAAGKEEEEEEEEEGSRL